MTPLPRVDLEFQNYQLGQTPADAVPHAKIGVASAGPATPQTLTRVAQVASVYGSGPLASALAVALSEAAPVIGVRVPATTPGTKGAVTQGTTGPELSVNGTPHDTYDVAVLVTREGALAANTAAVVITVDGMSSAERAVPVSGMLDVPGTGLTVTFADDTPLVAGETYTFSTGTPTASLAAVAETLTTLLASRPGIRFVHVLGVATPALVAAVDAILLERESRGYTIHAVLEARPMLGGWTYGDGTSYGDGSVWGGGETQMTYLAAMTALYADVVSERVAVALDGGLIYSPLTRSFEHRNSAWLATGRRSHRPIGESAYRVRSGPLNGVQALVFDANLTGDAGRFIALRTFDERTGVYVAQWPMLSAPGSDYDAVQRREVIDRAATVARAAAVEFLGDDVLVNDATGLILETEALAFEAFIEGRVRAALGGNASGVRVVVDRTLNILSTEHFAFDLSVIPLGYYHHVSVRVGYANPVLSQPGAAVTPATPPAEG